MNKHDDHHHQHANRHSGKKKHFPEDHPAPRKSNWNLHRNWKGLVSLVVLALMLFAMLAYVLSFDESHRPGMNTESPEVPAEAP